MQKVMEYTLEVGDVEVNWLYGSQAKGTSHSNSDIYMAIAF